jgi:hypothetical protein
MLAERRFELASGLFRGRDAIAGLMRFAAAGKDLLAANMEKQVAVQSSQSYGSGNSASFGTGKSPLAQVTAVAFRPTEGVTGLPL